MIARILVALVRVYQRTLSVLLRGALGPMCRFEPSCSAYAVACLEGHGAVRGSLLSVKRLCRCHPFHPGGFDPPPPPREGPRRVDVESTMGPQVAPNADLASLGRSSRRADAAASASADAASGDDATPSAASL